MYVDHQQERIINATVYFVSNTDLCTPAKLMHLLYLLDFGHFAETGRSVTENSYCALPGGPVSTQMYWDLQQPCGLNSPPTLLGRIVSRDAGLFGAIAQGVLAPKLAFDDDNLTKRQLRLLRQIAERYRADDGLLLTSDVCAKGEPWDKTFKGGGGQYACISYKLALDASPFREQLLESAREHREWREGMARARSVTGE